jgi:putative membrane protein
MKPSHNALEETVMLRRSGRIVLLFVAALLFASLSAGSFAVARDKDHHPHGTNGSAHRLHERCDRTHFSAWDEQWLMTSIEGDHFEIRGGKLAQQKARTQIVRDLAGVLIRDHSTSLADAVNVADKLGIEVPKDPSPSQQWELRAVAQFEGAAFDHWYADLEVQDHIQDISEARDEVEKGCNDDIRDLAKDDIPVLQGHLELARRALDAVN